MRRCSTSTAARPVRARERGAPRPRFSCAGRTTSATRIPPGRPPHGSSVRSDVREPALDVDRPVHDACGEQGRRAPLLEGLHPGRCQQVHAVAARRHDRRTGTPRMPGNTATPSLTYLATGGWSPALGERVLGVGLVDELGLLGGRAHPVERWATRRDVADRWSRARPTRRSRPPGGCSRPATRLPRSPCRGHGSGAVVWCRRRWTRGRSRRPRAARRTSGPSGRRTALPRLQGDDLARRGARRPGVDLAVGTAGLPGQLPQLDTVAPSATLCECIGSGTSGLGATASSAVNAPVRRSIQPGVVSGL